MRLMQLPSANTTSDGASFEIAMGCINSDSSSIMRYPANCRLPFCETQILMFTFTSPLNSSNVYTSLYFVSEIYYYLNEYMALKINDELIRYFIDDLGQPWLLLGNKLSSAYKNLTKQPEADGLMIKKRMTITSNADYLRSTSQKDSLNKNVETINLLNYTYLSNFVNHGYYNKGNLTFYVIEFGAEFSAILKSLKSFGDDNLDNCFILNFYKSNFVKITTLNSFNQQYYFDQRNYHAISNFYFCFNQVTTAESTLKPTQKMADQCINGSLSFESKYPPSVVNYTCYCKPGFVGTNCESLNPCFTQYNTIVYGDQILQKSIMKETTICRNVGFCIANKTTDSYFNNTGIRYTPSCMCRPQFGGKLKQLKMLKLSIFI
jgi:hypothetical protein